MDFREIYATFAERYQELVAAEDADGNLAPVLAAHLEPRWRVVECGAGTGRVTRLLQALGLRVLATEPAAAMLRQALALDGSDGTAHYLRADAAHLPARSGSFDAAVAGWVFGHQIEWRPSDWRATIGGFLAECERVTDGGRIVVIETLGTGHETPHPPPDLVGYYSWLENDLGFVREWIRTDYVFGDVETAAKTTGHFFGPEFAETVRSRRWARIPECTGIWTHRGRR